MKRIRFSDEQIIGVLEEHEAGVSLADWMRTKVASADAMLGSAALKDLLGKKW